MTEHGEEHTSPAGFSALGRRARELAHAPIAAGAHRLGRERLLLTVAFMRPKAQRALRAPRTAAWLSLAAAALVLLGFGFRRFGGDRPLTYEIEGAQLLAANYLVAPSTGNAGVRFSDGSQISAAPGTRLRVDSTRSDGARVLLEVGSTRAHVKHKDHSSWVFVAGPFDVHITGTRFALAWDAATQAVDLTLIDGSVEVESPLGASHIMVKTGQRFRASLIAGTMQLENSDGSAAPGLTLTGTPDPRANSLAQERTAPAQERTDARGDEPAATPDASEPASVAAHGGSREPAARSGEPGTRAASANGRGWRRTHAGARRAGSSVTWLSANTSSTPDEPQRASAQALPAQHDLAPAERWADLVRAGSFDAVIEGATGAGLAESLERGSAETVRALADAARYTDRSALAIRSLTVLRTRFPGTHHATAAAFLLGRTFESGHQDEEAKRFYQLYLREAGRGEYAAEALAGKMRMVARLDGADEARPIAQEYLDRYPNGVHAKSAHRLLDAH